MSEFRRRRIRSGVITACILVGIGAAFWIVINPSLTGLGGTHKDWLVHVTAETLVEHCEQIVLARYAEETVLETANSRSDPPSVKSFTDVYRRFQVVESFKGGYEPGDMIYVAWDAGYTTVNPETGGPRFNPRVVAPLPQGETYALFLIPRWSRPHHPDDPETRIWETPQGFDAALVDDQGRFSFQTNQYYRNALKDMGLKPVTGSGAPFELTTDDVKRLVASNFGDANQ